MPIQIHMLEFLRTGDFGGITPGMTRQQLIENLGDPPDWMVTGRRKRFQVSGIWKYGSIEFHFVDYSDVMWMIFSDHFPLVGSRTLHFDPWILRPGLTLPEAKALFDYDKLVYTVTTGQSEGMTLVTFKSGVGLYFELFDEKPDPEFTGFSYKPSV